MQEILLHSCCAPCTTFSSFDLVEKGFRPTLFFYNPNIHPQSEYNKRVDEIKKFAEIQKVDLIVGDYDLENWMEMMRGLENEPEGGKRCLKCYEMRLKKTAECAQKKGIELITTTLTISPHKKADVINKIGRGVCEKFGIKYWNSNFKKKDGFKKSCELSNEYGFYRQNYCGCIYSKMAIGNDKNF
jgi:predicted adenine nucleotide alpha hydrolase (AANH) superfamily ATPase